jgi:zinc finger protein 830
MTAEESAAVAQLTQNSEDTDGNKRKTKAEVDLEDEKEEATRALEDEFEEMEELEARVQRLRDKREDIRRKRSESQGQATAAVPAKLNGVGKENIQGTVAEATAVDEEDEEEEEDDDWDSFRLRGR